nr:hypothetical protein [Tanacetum cinerariifolium]
METMPEDNEIPTCMHNPIDEIGASNSRGVFYDRKGFPNTEVRKNGSMFGIDPVNSNTIKNTQAANAPLPTNNTQARNIPESTRTERLITRRVVAEQMLQTKLNGAAQRQAKQRQPSNFVPPRKKSERLKNLKVAEVVTQGGSTDNLTGK